MSRFARSKRTGSVKIIVIAGIAVVVILGAFSSAYLYNKHKNEDKQITAMKQAEQSDKKEVPLSDKLTDSSTPVMNPVDESNKSSTTEDKKNTATSDDVKSSDTKEESDSANTATNTVDSESTSNTGSSSTSHKRVTNINDREAMASKTSHQSHSSKGATGNRTTHTNKPQSVEHGSNSISYEYGKSNLPNYNKDYVISDSASNTTTQESKSSTDIVKNNQPQTSGSAESTKPSNTVPSETKPSKPVIPQDKDTQNEKAIFCQKETNEFWEELNAYRKSKGVSPLKWNNTIATVAGVHAKNGALDGYMKHNKDYPGQALLRYNLYGKPISSSDLLEPLRNSIFHSRILLDPNATEGAVSIYRQPDYTYFVVVDMNA